jgi:hypothetical protein
MRRHFETDSDLPVQRFTMYAANRLASAVRGLSSEYRMKRWDAEESVKAEPSASVAPRLDRGGLGSSTYLSGRMWNPVGTGC